jgi:ABC-type glycerol-3-phosphate transport system substrate-binding protein
MRNFTIAAAALMAGTALAPAEAQSVDCGATSGRVNIIGNEFPAIQTVGAAAQRCEGLDVSTNLTSEHESLNVPGMQGNPAEYTAAIVANSSLVALMNAGVVRPLDDLVAEYGQDIDPMRLITVNGQIMAVAFMGNGQHLWARKDILDEVGHEIPTSYEEMLEAAEAIREAGILEYPIAGTYMAGWNLAQEFVNMYIGLGGSFYEPGGAVVSINNEQGMAALEMMASVAEYMNPDYLTFDSNAVQTEWESGSAALSNMWGSRAGNVLDGDVATQEVRDGTVFAGPLTVGGGDIPATTLWWDGWSVAQNISDEDAAATFQALTYATSPEILNEENMSQTVWMIPGFEPGRTAEGVMATIQAGARPYPMLPYHGLLHTALGDNIADFLQGSESAEQTLADVEAAYTAAAQEQGFLN